MVDPYDGWSAARRQTPPRPGRRSAATTAKRLRSVVVEDESLIAASLVDWLQGIGLEVAGVAANRAEAIGLIERGGFDIAFIDVFLGRESHGLELARLAAQRAGAVVLVTGQLSHAISDTLASLRSAALLTKPFSAEQLRVVVGAVRQGLDRPR